MTPYIACDWDWPRAVLGPIFSASMVGLMAGYLLLSPLSDRFGHKRRKIAYSTLGFALTTLASVLVHDVPSLMSKRMTNDAPTHPIELHELSAKPTSKDVAQRMLQMITR